MKSTKFLVKQSTAIRGARQLYTRHGIRIIFVHSGFLGQFDFLTVVLTVPRPYLSLLTQSREFLPLFALIEPLSLP